MSFSTESIAAVKNATAKPNHAQQQHSAQNQQQATRLVDCMQHGYTGPAVSVFETCADESAPAIVYAISDLSAFAEYESTLLQDAADLSRQHGVLAARLEELTSSSLAGGLEAAGRLKTAAGHLEHLFRRIDALSDSFDEVNRRLMALHDVVHAIETPTSAKERASGLLRQLGMGSGSSSGSGATSSSSSKHESSGGGALSSASQVATEGTWSRVPMKIVIDGNTPAEFSQRVREVMADLDSFARVQKNK